jgi:nucleolar pre-ribosomal-associated protein 1
MELATYLYKLLVAGSKLIKENVTLVNSVLHIMLTTLKISQKRKIYQPHFTLTFEGLFQIYQALDVFNTSRPSASSELGLKTILMGFPRVDILHMVSLSLSLSLSVALSPPSLTFSLALMHAQRSKLQ